MSNHIVGSSESQELTEDDSVYGPPAKRQRLDIDAPRLGNRYENATAQGNSRNVYGNYTNTSNATNTTNNTYNVYPQHSTPTPVPQAEAHEQTPDTATGLMDALSFDEMDERYSTISAAYSKTCRWLFKTEKYKMWQDEIDMHSHQGFLWIKGKPGAGKSTVMKVAYDHGVRTFKEDAIVSFFFNARGTQLQRCAEGMYRSLLHQLLTKVPRLSAMDLNLGQRVHQSVWHVEQLKNLFREAVLAMGSTRLTCYVDALDECKDDEAQDMIEFFETLSELAVEKRVRLRVLLSSRHYPHIMIRSCLELILDGQEGHELDIADYTRNKLQIGNSRAAQSIRDEIQSKASGIFLWVVLVIRILNKAKSQGKVSQLKSRLKELPVDLHELFERILQRDSFDDRDRRTVLLTFQWLLFAQRPLSREELYFAVTSSMEDEPVEAWDPDEVSTDDMERFILDSSRGLAELTKGKQPTTQFIHESVRDYLLETGLRTLEPGLHNNLSGFCHERLKQCCHHYITKCEPVCLTSPKGGLMNHLSRTARAMESLQTRTAAHWPFLDYALAGLVFHADSAHRDGLSQTDFTVDFPCLLWHRLYNLTVKYHIRRLSIHASAIYIFVLLSAHNLVEIVLQEESIFSRVRGWQNEQHRSLLGASIDLDDQRMFNLLLAHGASPNSLAKGSCTCLSLAVKKDHLEMVRGLLDSGATLRSSSHMELKLAVHRGNVDIIRALLVHNPVAEQWQGSPYDDDQSPETIIRMALSLMDGEQALSDAVLRDRYKAVRLLLAAGVNVDSRAGEHTSKSALMLACSNGNKDMVRMLLDSGASLDLKDSYGRSALHVAAEDKRSSIVQMLLDRGADANTLTHRAATALMIASKRCCNDVVRILLDHRADVSLKDSRGFTALHHAAFEGNVGIAGMLLDKGSEINACDKMLTTAIMVASLNHHGDTVQLLLNSQADIGLKDRNGLTALHHTFPNGSDVHISRMLLDHGADIESTTNYGRTGLSTASLHSSLPLVKLLLERGAYVGRVRRPQLDHRDNEEIKRLLLERGATFIDKDEEP